MFSANSSQVSEDRLYVEDVFSVYVYAGNNTSQTITNGIDLSGKGGMVWTKDRTSAYNNVIVDSTRSLSQGLITNNTNPNTGITGDVTSFNSNGYSLGNVTGWFNNSGDNYVSWTFRKAPKFFDVVTYTGNGTAGRTVAHSLGVAPGTIIVKRTDAANGWPVYHRSMDATPQNYQMRLNATDGKFTTSPVSRWNNTAPTATEFTLSDNDEVNGSGATYVAYLFAHDTTSDGIIQCGSYTGTGSDLTVNLGWEPQWWLVKNTTTAGWSWSILDNMRGFSAASDNILQPNSSNAELTTTNISLTPTGVQYASTGNGAFNSSGATYIYIAIRRGPMRTPTSGTSVFAPITWSGTGTSNRVITGAPTASDSILINTRNQAANYWNWNDRLRGAQNTLYPYTTSAENAGAGATYGVSSINMDGFTQGSQDGLSGGYNASGATAFAYFFKRAPSFFDEVCYTGTGVARTLNHNLGVVPELMIVKIRNGSTYGWLVYSATSLSGNTLELNKSDAAFPDNGVFWTTTAPTSTVFSLNDNALNNEAGKNFVAYLFSSCPGVSKVGSYTGNGSSQTINCGFAAGARFVMIKRTDSTGDWYVWDSARGIVAGNDPRLSLNTTNGEVTTDDSVDTDSSGFVVNQLSATNINVNAATYLYMAVA